MDVFCITTNNPQFQKLLAESGEKQGVFAMTISKWMTQNEVYDRYPTLQELGITVMEGIKPGVEELFDTNLELANAVYEALGFKTNITQDNKTNIIAISFGTGAIFMAYLCQFLSNTVYQLVLSIFGLLGGPILGVISLGMFFEYSNWIVIYYIFFH